ncbi:CotH kinase family protein [Paenibacillus sp. GCM10012307]|uniref:CotH kinase family protein n=1 Tax=Paenibacillus roseus TaxID=2798579 RepID=A0A934MT40_9BACL|nr:CotH kinase family protein [Paenibacillus roseus]MBJ6363864.1 CotH kinase family protein [Paenibacillus roseus]
MPVEALPLRSIHIDSNEIKRMQEEDVWSTRFIQVTLEMDGIAMPARIRHRGGHTRLYPKKSYEVVLDNGTALQWNAEYDDPSMLRNALSFHYFNTIGVEAPGTKHCNVEWNGQPLGVYLEIESVDQAFFERRGLECRSIHYAVNDSANFRLTDPITRKRKTSWYEGYELKLGKKADRSRLIAFIRKLHQTKGRELRSHLLERLDTPQYLKWLAGAVLTGNYDGFDQNYALYEVKQGGKYRIAPWDYEGTWGRNCYGKPCGAELVRVQGYNRLTKLVLAVPTCRSYYRNLLTELLDTSFTERELGPLVQAMHQSIAQNIQRDVTRKWSYTAFENEYSMIMNYIRERRRVIQKELKQWRRADRQKIPMLK